MTAHRPDQWLRNEQDAESIGWMTSGVGLAALVLVAAFDVMRRRDVALRDSLDSPSRPIAGLIVGLISFIAGMALQFKILGYIRSGTPIPFSVSSRSREVTRGFAQGWQLCSSGCSRCRSGGLARTCWPWRAG